MRMFPLHCYCGHPADLVCRHCRLRSADLCHCPPTPDAPGRIPLDTTPTATDCEHARKVVQHFFHGYMTLHCRDCRQQWRIVPEDGGEDCPHPDRQIRNRPDGGVDLACTHCGHRLACEEGAV